MSLNDITPVAIGRDSSGRLTIAGCDMNGLAEEYGTPLYVYDAETIQRHAARLNQGIARSYAGRYEIAYAAKAYFSLPMARKLAALGLSVDTVSLGELEIARRAGFSPQRVHLHGNNKTEDELRAALDWSIRSIVVDSLDELAFLDQLAEKRGGRARILLRVTPGITVDTHHAVQTAHAATKFGLSAAGGQAAEAIRQAQQSPRLALAGLHTHLGSNLFQPEAYAEAAAVLCDLAEEMSLVPEEINLGGGWGVPYLPDQGANDPEAWLSAAGSAVERETRKRGWPLPVLGIEPGRWLVARAGVAVYRVGSVKTIGDGTRVVSVDGGMADNPRPALYGSRYTVLLASRAETPPYQTVNIAGKFCESGDVLIHGARLPEVRRGDLLAIPAAGAYQLSMASNYNLAARPAVLWLENGQVEVLQKREKAEEQPWWLGE